MLGVTGVAGVACVARKAPSSGLRPPRIRYGVGFFPRFTGRRKVVRKIMERCKSRSGCCCGSKASREAGPHPAAASIAIRIRFSVDMCLVAKTAVDHGLRAPRLSPLPQKYRLREFLRSYKKNASLPRNQQQLFTRAARGSGAGIRAQCEGQALTPKTQLRFSRAVRPRSRRVRFRSASSHQR